MNKTCEFCRKKYDVQESMSFFRLQFCSEQCEDAAGEKMQGYSIYLCHVSLTVLIHNGRYAESEIVREGTKWRKNETKSHGLNSIHLESLSGMQNEKLSWLEITEDALKEHFQKI
ncbi:MAG: hypothetical protein RR548_09965 [Carnobacterium sp.]|uniref:hypothetical protein n=1 Tax=Carnobacterium sp. TaxID=48221 RepID=UPI002FC9A413